MIGRLLDKLTYANVVGTIALIAALSGGTLGAYAAFRVPPNSVGSRQLKAKAVSGGKIANATISGGKIQEETITGQNIKFSALGTVPEAANATNAANANTVGGHAASCPAGTTLIRGLCYETSSTEAPNLKAAAEGCATKGGYLPTPMQLYSTKGVLFLGDGVGTEKRFTDDVYSKVGEGKYSTIVIDGAGALEEQEITQPARYNCVFPLVR
jgi:hypothetical protein